SLTKIFDADGILLLSSVLFTKENPADIPAIRKAFDGIPCVSIGDRLPDITSIIIHNRESMQKIMDHLVVEHGYRKFMYLSGPPGHRDNVVREHIFKETLKQHLPEHPEIESSILVGGFRELQAQQIVSEYILAHPDNPLDVIVAANDNMALGALKALHASSDERWNSCAVTGFDDIPQARLEIPSLTTVRQPFDELGRLAVRTIRDLAEGRKVPNILQIDSKVILRNSCGCRLPKSPSLVIPDSQLKKIQYQNIRFEGNLRNVSSFGQRLTTAESLSELVNYLGEFLHSIGVASFFLLLDPKSSGSSCTMSLIYSRFRGKESVFLDDCSCIDLSDFFLQDFRIDKKTSAFPCAYLLNSGNEELGLILYETEEYAHPHICSAGIFISNTVKRLQVLEDQKRYAQKLEEQVRLRTIALVEMNNKLKEESKQRLAVEEEVLHISEMERLRFSLDLHDDICQRLAGISMFSKSLRKGADLTELSEMIDETLLRTRQYAHDSFPVELDSLGLNEAIGSLCNSIQKQTGCQCSYKWAVSDISFLSNSQQINLYRIIQEALNNIIKHSGATKAVISVEIIEDMLVVSVNDNGKGVSSGAFTKNAEKSKKKQHIGIGLKSMEYRAHQIGATYLLRSSEKSGTLIELKIPCNN
ncbi:MAG TPA: substrate-binding domain-containing protein, partial [Treponemataceae bacterium]|nr:substrate-binding domain-containing protein [Treponemataceae bacterium]